MKNAVLHSHRQYMGRHGVAGVMATTDLPAPHHDYVGDMPPAPSSAPVFPEISVPVSALAGQPWPIPRRRLELSTLFISEFACLLLIAPFYLILGHGSQLYSFRLTDAPIFHTAVTQSVEAFELILAFPAMLAIPFLSRRRRSTGMILLGLAALALVFLLTSQQGQLLMIVAGYPAVALLALVSLDALTGVRPAAVESESFKNRQLALGAAVLVLWTLPTIMLFTCHTINSIVSSYRSPWIHFLLATAMLGALGAGIIALVGHFSTFTRRVNIMGRLCGTLSLTLTMGMGLWSTMNQSKLFVAQQWLHPELLWIFILTSAALLLSWSGLTQKFIITAAMERGEPTD